MSDPRPEADLAHGVPIVAITTGSTRANRTGSWKYIRPMYQDKVAPCNQGCPVGIDIAGYMNLVREGRLGEAVELLLRENPLPAVTGRVCHHPCEGVCNRAQYDDAVSIHAVERMLGDLALESAAKAPPAPEHAARKETVGIVGSGPAGLSCAYHLARMGYGVTVYEADAEPGGILRYAIPEYHLPRKVLAAEVDRIRALGVRFRCGERVGRDVPFAKLERHDAVFVATGLRDSRTLGVQGENAHGVRAGLEFLRQVDCGGRPDLGRRVVVVGGDFTAIASARAAVRLGAEVIVLFGGERTEMSAPQADIDGAIAEGVLFEFSATPLRVRVEEIPDESPIEGVEYSFGEAPGRQDGIRARVSGLECVRLRLGEADAAGHRRRLPVDGSGFLIPADTVLVALGEQADFGFLPPAVARGSGAVSVDPLGTTSVPTVFAGGDIAGGARTVASAIGSGKRAAIGIDRFLRLKSGETIEGRELAGLRFGPEGNASATRWLDDDPVRRANPANDVVSFAQINTAHFAHVARRGDRAQPPGGSRTGFEEVNLGLAREDATLEACRCFNCGTCNSCEVCLIFCPDAAISRRSDGGFQISYKYCKGCGVCVAECPRCAMAMTREGV